MLSWLRQFNIFCFLDSQQYAIHPHNYEIVVGAGARHYISCTDTAGAASFLKENNSWAFGHLSYEFFHKSFKLKEHKTDNTGFPNAFLFAPEVVLLLKDNILTCIAKDPEMIVQQIQESPDFLTQESGAVRFAQSLDKAAYIDKIEKLKRHLQRGDCYEINFCQEFYAENTQIDPWTTFVNLTEVSPNPFSAFYRIDDRFLLCASPERFISREENKLISQPIKGTIKRDRENNVNDLNLQQQLKESSKERAENIMIVDLVRNDLSRICKEGSVQVEELCGIYSFPQVHQMISTVSGQVDPERSFTDIIEATFPMGSMTGAPKKKVMELIDQYEISKRGIFSGSVGYIKPNGDFDFNVVIRSIVYNSSNQYLSYHVGSGITYYCDPEREWEECLLKGEAIRKVFGNYSL